MAQQKKYFITKRWFHKSPYDKRNPFFQWSIYVLNSIGNYEYVCGTTIQNYKEAKKELVKEL